MLRYIEHFLVICSITLLEIKIDSHAERYANATIPVGDCVVHEIEVLEFISEDLLLPCNFTLFSIITDV